MLWIAAAAEAAESSKTLFYILGGLLAGDVRLEALEGLLQEAFRHQEASQEMIAGSLAPMRPDPCVSGPVPPSSRTFSAFLVGPPLPSARTTWISKSLGRPTGGMS
jgi:hypothetical protein